MQCPNCHFIATIDSIFCPNCGSKLQNNPNQPTFTSAPLRYPPPSFQQVTPKNTQSHGKSVILKPVVIVLIVALIITVPVSIYFLMNQQTFLTQASKATSTSDNTFEPVEVTMSTDFSVSNWVSFFFNEDGSELNLIYANMGSNGKFISLDTTTNTLTDSIGLSTFTSHSTMRTTDSNQIYILVEQPDNEEAYYLTHIDTNSKTAENIYLGEGLWASNVSFLTNNYDYYQIARSDEERQLLRVNLNTVDVETLGTMPDSISGYDILGNTEDNSGVLILTDQKYNDNIFYSTATLTLANWNDPLNEDLWQTLNTDLTYSSGGIFISDDGTSVYTCTVEAIDSSAELNNFSESDEQEQHLVMRQYDTNSGEEVASLAIPGFSGNFLRRGLNADSSLLIINEMNKSPGTYAIIDLSSMELITSYKLDNDESPVLAISPTNELMYVRNDSVVNVVEIVSGNIVASMDFSVIANAESAYAYDIAISPDASFAYVDIRDGDNLRLFQFETGEKISALETASQWIVQNVTPTHLIVGTVVLVIAVAGGIIAVIIVRRRKKASTQTKLY